MPRVEKAICKKIIQFRSMTCTAKPLYENPCPGVMKFTVFVDPSLVNNIVFLNRFKYDLE